MKIVVCMKQVPDTNEVRIDPKTGTLIREGVPSIINPDDKSALEEAIKLKDKYGAHVTVLSMGPQQATLALREAICMGADEGILLSDRAFAGSDTLATSRALAGALKKLEYDIVFAGRQAIDGDTAQVGPEIAEHLDLPQITYVEKLDVEGNILKVRRALEDGYEEISVAMPVLLTAIKELNTPRYMNIKNIFASKQEDIKIWSVNDIVVDKAQMGLSGSPTKVKKSMTKEAKGKGVLINKPAREAVEYTIEKLREKHYI
ncbi:MAG: electron transfer flavoprotein subunit beta/FixA family protein [Clostridiales bacterium]|nr:electron transfer flavoprotein subunit beta/FixA family protein [Clostridiales bacterium]